jgi:hypothetical protein
MKTIKQYLLFLIFKQCLRFEDHASEVSKQKLHKQTTPASSNLKVEYIPSPYLEIAKLRDKQNEKNGAKNLKSRA